MFKKLILTAILCFAPTQAFAQSLDPSAVQVTSASRQPNGLLTIQTTETWAEGYAVNTVMLTVKDFSCKDRIGTIALAVGNIGIESFNNVLNEKRYFPPDNKYGAVFASLCR